MKALSNERPLSIVSGGGSSYLYHWDIEEVVTENEDGVKQTQYEYEEVRVYAPLTRAKIVRAVINALWDKDVEQKLINDYNTCVCGLGDDDTAIDRYKAFLTERERVRTQVYADCADNGIK